MDLSIIIVNWRSAKLVLECIESIRKETRHIDYEFIVIDNASFDGCEQLLRESGMDVVYIQSSENLGFAKANNLAHASSRGESLLFLNPDTVILGSSIELLYRSLRELPSAGIVGPKLLNADGSVQTSCIQSFPTVMNQVLDFEALRMRTPRSALWGMAPLFTQPDRPAEVEVVCGASLMIKREVFERVNRFSEDYFMYAEDADLCLKVMRAGWKNYFIPDATVVHFGGSSSGQAASGFAAVVMRDSIWRFLTKWHGEQRGRVYRFAMLVVALFRIAMLGLLFPVQVIRARWRNWLGAFRKWWAILGWSMRPHGDIELFRAPRRCAPAEVTE